MIDFVAEWCGFSGEARAQVEARMVAAAALLRAEWASYWAERELSAQGLRRFYETSHAVTYDLLGRGRLAQEQDWPQVCDEWLARYGCKSVLDYGCGVGAFGFHLQATGRYQVTLCDLPGRHRRVVERLAARMPQVRVCEPEALAVGEAYDAIVCLEVMEHVFDPAHVTTELLRRLRPGGVFFASWSFPEGTQDNPLHLRGGWTNEGYQQFLEGQFGLEWVNRGSCWARVLRLARQSAGELGRRSSGRKP